MIDAVRYIPLHDEYFDDEEIDEINEENSSIECLTCLLNIIRCIKNSSNKEAYSDIHLPGNNDFLEDLAIISEEILINESTLFSSIGFASADDLSESFLKHLPEEAVSDGECIDYYILSSEKLGEYFSLIDKVSDKNPENYRLNVINSLITSVLCPDCSHTFINDGLFHFVTYFNYSWYEGETPIWDLTLVDKYKELDVIVGEELLDLRDLFNSSLAS